MSQTLTLAVKGLITNPNNLTPNIVDGALSYADNVVVSKDNIAESRRGFDKYNEYLDLGNNAGTISNLYSYDSTIIAHHNEILSRDTGLGTWVDYSGTFTSASQFKMRSVEENQNLYITTDIGVKKLDAIDSEFYNSGVISSLDGFGSSTGTTGWLADDSAVSYRMVWVRTDANDNLVIGAPSSRLIVSNVSGLSTNVELTFLIPGGITTSYRYQIYRSAAVTPYSSEPTDEMQLVLTGTPTQGEIDDAEFVVLDNISDSLKGVTLYTSPSQEGIINANYEPPLCRDICLFKNHTFFGNCETKYTYFLTLLGTGTDGLDVGDTITIAGTLYTAAAAEDSSIGNFKLFDTASPAKDIENTAISLIRVINKYATNTLVYAYYQSGFEDLPGKLRLQARELGQAVFYVLSSKANCWTPSLPVSGTTEAATNDAKLNRVFISKDHQPEAVPLLNYIDVGSANKAILRIINLRDSVFVFKEDSIYKITGENIGNFRATLHDSTTKILAPDSAVSFNNTVFCMSLQGVISVSESGIAVVSRNIEQELLQLIQNTNFDHTTFGISYESERSYILFVINTQANDFPNQAYVFNSFTQSWVRWTLTATCGFVNPVDDKLYLGKKEIGYSQYWVYKERKTFTVNDFVDDSFGISILAVAFDADGNTVISVNRTDDCLIDYWIVQTDSIDQSTSIGKILSINYDNDTITVSVTSSREFTSYIGDIDLIYKPIVCRVKYVMQTAGNPGVLKQFQEATFFFRNDTAAEIKIGYETSLRPGYSSTASRIYNIGLWGQGNWGDQPWGGVDDTYCQPLRVGIPRDKQKSIGISLSVESSNAFSPFALAGVAMQFETLSYRLPYRGRIAGNG